MTDHPLFAHQLEALRRRREIEDDLAVDGTLIRAGYRRRRRDEDQVTPRIAGRRTGIDLWAPSPLITFQRDLSGVRSPHLSVTPISKTVVPRSVTGETHPDYPDQSSSVEHHYGYIERQDGKDGTALGHGDYIERDDAREVDHTTGRASYVYSNISRNPNKRRAFARAVWDHEMTPRTHHLESWVSHLPWWEKLAKRADAPAWVQDATSVLKKEAAKKTKGGKIPTDRLVQICKVTQREAYDRIVWCETQPGWDRRRKQVAFNCGPGGRVQYRIVYELPHGLSAEERMHVVRLMCRHLKQWGFMYVAAIHQPDPHNDPRNSHVHIDMYDRPCRFLKRFGKWDFEVTRRDKKGHIRHPYERKKIADFTRDPDKRDHRAWGKKVIASFRRSFVEFTNDVLARGGHAMRYDARDFATRKIALTPTKKLGGKATAAEKDGIRTRDGDINAVWIWGDVFKAIDLSRDEQLKEAEQAVSGIEKSIGRIPAGPDRDAITKGLAEHRRTELQLIERAHSFETGDAEIRMALSRADTILREAAKRAANGTKSRGFKSGQLATMRADVQADAEQHVRFVRSISPSAEQIADEREAIAAARLEIVRQREAFDASVTEALSRLKTPTPERHSAPAFQTPRIAWKTENGRAVVFDLRVLASTRAASPKGKFTELEIGRVVAWLNKHRSDSEAMTFTDDTVTFRPPPAVANFLIQYQSAPALRAWIGGEQVRRVRATPFPKDGVADEVTVASSPPNQNAQRNRTDAFAERGMEQPALDHGEGQRELSRLAKGPPTIAAKTPIAATATSISQRPPDPAKLASIETATRALREATYPPQVRGPNGFALAPGYSADLEGADRWEAEKAVQDAHAAKWAEFLEGLRKALEQTARANPIVTEHGNLMVQPKVLSRELDAAYAGVKSDSEVVSLLRQVDDDIRKREKEKKKRQNEEKERSEREQRELEAQRAARLGKIQNAVAIQKGRILAANPAQARQDIKINLAVLEDAAAMRLIARENGGADPHLVFVGRHHEIIAGQIGALSGGMQYLTTLRAVLGTQVEGAVSGTLPLMPSGEKHTTRSGLDSVVQQRDGGQGR